MVADRAKWIVWEVQEPLYNLVKDIPGIDQVKVRPREGNELPAFDYHCEIFTLPRIFETTFDSVPPPFRPPFSPDERIRGILKRERDASPSCKHIGLVWSGNPKNDVNPYRACGLVHMLPLLDIPNCRFYSLQKGAPRRDIDKFVSQAAGVIDLSPHLPDLAATATAIDELDLVITTDTSIPHLAGTIGAESWVLLHQPSDWRWTIDREVTPWYPQLKLYRQTTARVWKDLLEKVRQDLVRFADS